MAINSFKTVFLIDQSLENDNRYGSHSIDGLVNIVRVCVLKILTYFASYRDAYSSGDKTNHVHDNRVEWDVSYFRGKSRRFRDKPRFREFTLKHFESFETELETRFHVLETAVENCGLQSESVHNLEDVESDVLSALKHALRTLVHDYSWDRPDIMSPVKLSRSKCSQSDQRKFHKRCTVESTDMKRNFVFIIAECPHDAEDLDISVLNSSAVLRSFLPNDFHRQFTVDLGIRLFWINTDSDKHSVSSTDYRVCILGNLVRAYYLVQILNFIQKLFTCHCLTFMQKIGK